MSIDLISAASMINKTQHDQNRTESQEDGGEDGSTEDSHSSPNHQGGKSMQSLASIKSGIQTYSISDSFDRDSFSSWPLVGAIFGLIGGMVSALAGGLITAVSWMSSDPTAGHSLSHLGTGLLFMTIPLLIFGGYCLDLLEGSRPKPRRFDDDDDD